MKNLSELIHTWEHILTDQLAQNPEPRSPLVEESLSVIFDTILTLREYQDIKTKSDISQQLLYKLRCQQTPGVNPYQFCDIINPVPTQFNR